MLINLNKVISSLYAGKKFSQIEIKLKTIKSIEMYGSGSQITLENGEIILILENEKEIYKMIALTAISYSKTKS